LEKKIISGDGIASKKFGELLSMRGFHKKMLGKVL